MSNPTRAEQITALEAELVLVKAQQASASAGSQSFSLGDFSQTTVNYESLAKRRTSIEKSLQRLYRGGRGIPIDLSYTEYETDTGGGPAHGFEEE